MIQATLRLKAEVRSKEESKLKLLGEHGTVSVCQNANCYVKFFKGCKIPLLIPVVASWVRKLQTEVPLQVPLDVFEELTVAGGDFGLATYRCNKECAFKTRKVCKTDPCSFRVEFCQAYDKTHHVNFPDNVRTWNACFKLLKDVGVSKVS